MAALLGALPSLAFAQQQSEVTLQSSETFFTLAASMNACGYDQGLKDSEPVRAEVRRELADAIAASPQAQEAHSNLCQFYRDHRQENASRELAQYVSLGFSLGDPPKFAPTIPVSDMAPDASYVVGIIPYLQQFYATTNLHAIWLRHQTEYNADAARYHDALQKMVVDTLLYLRLPFSGYADRHFAIDLEPMTAPGVINARNYGFDYFVLTSPENGSIPTVDNLHLHGDIRHAYLHYLLDGMTQNRATTFRRLSPLLDSVQTAPMDVSYKRDIALLVTESLIRAIEARMIPGGNAAETVREQAAERDMREGFILTDYFFDALKNFEKGPAGMKDTYGDLLYGIEVPAIQKQASKIEFAKESAPDPLKAQPRRASGLDDAEKALVLGNPGQAQQLAQQWMEQHPEDKGRALFILARAAVLSGDPKSAESYFQQTLQVATEPRYKAWSHIYLGRLYDMQEQRDQAVAEYRAALEAGDNAQETRAAAEKGLKHPWEPPQKH